ncbi:hypothetical protein CLAIMM_09265 [Cladophialophora immunda]|nr:hypothetical protein CLAIMM_09265 [Cladophialophora immunda]
MGTGATTYVSLVEETGGNVDEATPLLGPSADAILHSNQSQQRVDNVDEREGEVRSNVETQSRGGGSKSLASIIAVLLIGVFASQADTSMVLATYGKISSEFNDLDSGSWLLTSYMLAQCVAQPLYGKLSDIYGRKRCLQASYVVFIIGTVGSGVGFSMPQIIAARAVQGCGGAGMLCMVSIVLTDLVPVHELALYRSYVNVISTAGRSCGGAIGGFLAQTIGWRWAFIGQGPLVLIALWLVERRLPDSTKGSKIEQSTWSKFRRIDIPGAICMSLSIAFALLVLELGGKKVAWKDPLIIAAAITALTSGIAFILIERFWAQEPIFPLRLMTQYTAVTSYTIVGLQTLTQTAVLPLYWQVTKNATPAVAGFYLIPAIVGNTMGGLLTGRWIMKYHRYKVHCILAALHSIVCFTSLLMTWRGDTNILHSLLIFSGGFGTGQAHSAVFVALANGVAEEDIAMASSGFYLSSNIGGVLGVSIGSAVHQVMLRRGLVNVLKGRRDWREIIRKATEDIGFVQKANESLRKLLMPAYIASFHAVFYFGLVCSTVVFVAGLLVREKRLREK